MISISDPALKAGRFHVIRMIQHHFLEFCKRAQESIRWKRTIIYLLRKRASNITSREREILHKLLISRNISIIRKPY